MTNWKKIIEDNYSILIVAMNKAAHDVAGSSPDVALRVELNDDGHVDIYYTQPNVTSADVQSGKAIKIKDFYGDDERWTPEWADNYDPEVDLELLMLYHGENFKTFSELQNGDY